MFLSDRVLSFCWSCFEWNYEVACGAFASAATRSPPLLEKRAIIGLGSPDPQGFAPLAKLAGSSTLEDI
jgi:hypothetical protein